MATAGQKLSLNLVPFLLLNPVQGSRSTLYANLAEDSPPATQESANEVRSSTGMPLGNQRGEGTATTAVTEEPTVTAETISEAAEATSKERPSVPNVEAVEVRHMVKIVSEKEAGTDGANAGSAEEVRSSTEISGSIPETPPRSHMDQLSGFFDAAKRMVTCTCTKVTWRVIQLGISLWQIADMVSDGLQTKKFWDLSVVSKNHLP